MSIDETKVVVTPSANGTAQGILPIVSQGSYGPITIEVVGRDNKPVALDGEVSGYRWKEGGDVFLITGNLTAEGAKILWDISATDTSEFSTIQQPWLVVFSCNGLITDPVEWIVQESRIINGVTADTRSSRRVCEAVCSIEGDDAVFSIARNDIGPLLATVADEKVILSGNFELREDSQTMVYVGGGSESATYHARRVSKTEIEIYATRNGIVSSDLLINATVLIHVYE